MLFSWIQKHSLSITVTVCLAAAFFLAGAARVTVTPDNRIFYGPENPYFQEFLRFESNYTSNNNILFVVSSSEAIYQDGTLEAVEWLTDQAWRILNTIRVDSIASYPVAIGEEDSIEIVTLAESVCRADPECADPDLTNLLKPQIINRLVSSDLLSTGVVATVTLEKAVPNVVAKITGDANTLAEEFRERYPSLELVVTGGVPMMQAFATYSAADLGILLPIALAIVSVLLSVILGRVSLALTLIGIAFLAVISTVGLAGWIGQPLNNATSIVPLVVFTLVVTSSMHILIHFVRQAAEEQNVDAAVRAALHGNLYPMIFSSLTTMVGLLSLLFLESPPLKELGYLSAFGVLVGTALSLVVLPLLLRKIKKVRISNATIRIQQLLNLYARKIEMGRSPAVPALMLLGLSMIGIFNLKLDDNFVDYFSKSTEFRQSTDRATQLLSGPNHIEILLENDSEDGIFDKEYINYLMRLTDFLRTHRMVSNASSFSDVLTDLSEAFHTPLSEASSADEIAQWYLVYELSLQRGQSNTDFVRSDQKESRVSVLLKETTSIDIQNLEREIYDWHKDHQTKFSLRVTGENIPVAYLSGSNIRSMVAGIFLSIAFTALAIGISLKRVKLGIVTLAATVLPIVFGFGLWGMLNDSIGLAATAIIALTIGIVVDDAIHMVYRYMDARDRLDNTPWEAAGFCLHRVGTALTATSLVMIGGLSALLFSNFELNSSFGACTCLIIAVALAFDLLVVPRLLVWTDSRSAA